MRGNATTMPTNTESLIWTRITSAGENTCSWMPGKKYASMKFMRRGMKPKASTEIKQTAMMEISRRLRSSARCSVNVISMSSDGSDGGCSCKFYTGAEGGGAPGVGGGGMACCGGGGASAGLAEAASNSRFA